MREWKTDRERPTVETWENIRLRKWKRQRGERTRKTERPKHET